MNASRSQRSFHFITAPNSIEEAIRSVVAQTVPVDEIVVVDDGSKDDGPEIVEGLSWLHPITFLRKPNGGQSSARNFAINHIALPRNVAFLDQDDICYEDHIERLKAPFVQRERPGTWPSFGGNLDQIDRERRGMIAHNVAQSHSNAAAQDDALPMPGARHVHAPKCVPSFKSGDRGCRFFDESLIGYEDDDLFIRMFSAGYRFVYPNEAVTKWRIYSSSTSFSSVMSRSRLRYFRKKITEHRDDAGLSVF